MDDGEAAVNQRVNINVDHVQKIKAILSAYDTPRWSADDVNK